jgi:hypothetical protein
MPGFWRSSHRRGGGIQNSEIDLRPGSTLIRAVVMDMGLAAAVRGTGGQWALPLFLLKNKNFTMQSTMCFNGRHV